MNFIDDAMLFMSGVLITFLFIVFFTWVPFSLIGESKCLKAGFAESKTTIFLDSYCYDKDGALVSVKELNQ